MAEITLTSAMRANLINLQTTNVLLGQTQNRLATGKKVNSALDNPTNFFAAAAHISRANNLASRKDGMTESIQAIRAADVGVTGMKALLETAKGIVAQASTTAQSGLAALYTSFNTVATQINQLIKDSGYKGNNFLNGTSVSLDVLFNETGTNKLTVQGFNAKVSGLLASSQIGVGLSTVSYGNAAAAASGLLAYMTSIASFKANSAVVTGYSATKAGFSNAYNLAAIDAGLTQAISQLEAQSAKLATNLAVINSRLDFTNSMINVEKTGSDNLTLADQNEEGANMLMLQTRNQLGTTSLSLASQAAQAILRLF